MTQWSANMDYLTDGDSFTDIASHPPSARHGDDSSYFDMAGSGMTERPNYYDPHLVETRRSSLSQDALSNQLTTSYPATESSRRLSIPSISGVTGQTSVDYDFMHNSDFIGDAVAQPVPRSDLDHSASYLYGLTGPFSDENNPPRPDDIGLEDLAEGPASQPPVINVQPPQQPTYSAIMGLSERYNSENLPHILNSVNRECQRRGNHGEGGLSQQCLFELQRIAGDLTMTVNSMIHDQRPSAPNVPGSTGSSAGQPKKEKHLQCPLPDECDASFGSMGALKRHVAEQHHPQYEFHCPVQECQSVATRKHKIKEHITNFHRLMVPKDGQTITQPHILDRDIEANKHELPVPSKCTLCPRPVNTWVQFYNCLMSHNGCPSGPRDPASRRGSADCGSTRGGNGLAENYSGAHGPGPGMPAAAPTNTGLGINLVQGQSSSFSGIGMNQSNPHPASFPMTSSRSDGLFGGTANPSASLDGSTQHGTPDGRGTNHGNLTRPPMGPPRPGSSRSSSHHNVRPPRQRCPRCRAVIQSFRRAGIPVNFCKCRPLSSIMAPVRRPQGHLPQNINPQFLNRQSPLQTQIPQQTPGRTVMGNEFQQEPQFQQPQYQGDSSQPMNDFMGPPPSSPGGTQYSLFPVLDADEPVFSEVDMENSLRETKVNPLGRALMSCLPLRIPAGNGVIKALKQGVNLIHDYTSIAPQISVSPPPAKGTSPPTQCNCPCRTAALLKEAYEAHAELAPGKQVKLGLKILSPEDREAGKSQQHLRARVQLVVRLLKLRASAAKSSRKKKRKSAKASLEKALKSTFDRTSQPVADEADDTDASETDSIFSEDMDSMFSSFSDLMVQEPSRPTSPSPNGSYMDTQEYEETTELSFNVDLESILSTMSRWSDELSDELCSDNTSMDPARVLEYLFKYIMYVMMALSHASDDGHGSRLH